MSQILLPVLATMVVLSMAACQGAATRYEKHVAAGREQLATGRLQDAILSFKSALAARPEDSDARKLLVECYLERGAKEPAAELLKGLTKGLPNDPVIPLLEARLALLADDADRALEILESYMAVHGETPVALVLVGHAHGAKNLWSEALQAYESAISKDGQDGQAWLGKASVLARLKRDAEADDAATHAIAANPHLGNAYLLRAQLARNAKNLDAAHEAYQQAMDKDPRVEFAARFGLVQVLLAQEQHQAAHDQAAILVKDYPGRPEGSYLRGVASYMLANWDGAVSDLQTCLSKAPDHPGALFYLALSQYQRQQWEQALGAVKSLQARYPTLQPVEMLLAELLLRTGDFAGAAERARHVLAQHPDSALMHRVLGSALIAAGDSEGGAEALEEAQRLAPDERLEFALGDLYLSMNQLDRASATFEAAAAANPQDRAAIRRLFYTRLRQGDTDGALGLIDHLQQEAPDDPMWLNMRGAALLAKDDPAGAEAAWQKIVAMAPDLPAAHLNLAGLYKRQEKWEAARREYAEVLALKPHHSVAHRELAMLDLRDGKPADAVAHLQASLDAVADGGVAAQLAALQLQLGDAEAARVAAEKATQFAPNLPEGWLQAGIAALAQGRLDEGEVAIRKASELAPQSGLVWYHLGGVEARRGNWSGARTQLQKAAAIAPDDPTIVHRLVMVEFAAQRPQAAEGLAMEFLKRHPDLPNAYRIAAQVQEMLQHPEAARQTLAQARQRFGDQMGIILLQAELDRRAGRIEEAAALYSRALEIEPDAVPIMMRKAAAQAAAGQFEEALSGYQAVLGLSPNQPVALNNLAYLYTDVLDQPQEALASLAKIDREVLAKNPPVRDTLGWAQLKSGDAAAAVTTLRKVVQELPEVATVRYHFGAALIAAGRVAEGRGELQAAIDMRLSPAEEKAARGLLRDHP